MRPLSPATARQKYWLGIIGSLALALSLKLLLPLWQAYKTWPHEEWKDLAKDVSNACIIAVLLALLVDAALKEELLTKFAKDISGHIIGNLLPLKLRKHLMDYLEMSLVRERWNITYILEPCAPQHVKVTIMSDYEMENRSGDDQRFQFVMKVEKSWFPNCGQNLITSVRVNDDPETRNPPCVEKDGNWVYEQFVDIPPYEKENPQHFRFRTQSQQYFFESAFSPFISMWPVPDATVTVKDPSTSFEVVLDPTFKPRKAPCRTELGDGVEWKINEPILPGQGFFVRWSKRSVPAAAPVRGVAAASKVPPGQHPAKESAA
jgi:hypothetical protein